MIKSLFLILINICILIIFCFSNDKLKSLHIPQTSIQFKTVPCSSSPVDFTDFSELDKLSLLDRAVIVDDALRLTQSEFNIKGVVWFKDKIDISNGFETTFEFRISKIGGKLFNGTQGADSFAFVLQNNDIFQSGGGGMGIGYEGIPNYKTGSYDNIESIGRGQYDDYGKRLYYEAADLNGDGKVTLEEKWRSYLSYKEQILDSERTIRLRELLFLA